ncbi:putative DNA binding domain-containing protein [Candidatus Parcubacteria bacterium]|nr:putative DNA binding domain-containing protein [Candidatus Parcubacteria bacterium]
MASLIEKILNIPEEGQTIEFKRLFGDGVVKKTLQTIVAMTNAEGGAIILGVDDPEKTGKEGLDRIYGVEEGYDHYDEIGREIQKISPPISGIWPPKHKQVTEKKFIAIIMVPKATDGFHCYNNKVYVRQLKSNKLLSPQEIIDLSYAKGFKKADRELVKVDFKLLNTAYFQTWQQSRRITGKEIFEVLEKIGLARKNDNNKLLPTRAAVMLFAEYPTNLMDTKCTIRVFQYFGMKEIIKEAPNLIGTPKTIEGPVVRLISDAHDYVLGLLQSGIKVPSGFVTQYQIPERAVKEAITNAVIHRDYHIKRDIEIKIFENRIEIESPGLFPYNITPANIGRVRSAGYRNDLLVKHLREFPSPPNLDQNEGIRAMRSEMKAQNLYPPLFWTYPALQDVVRVVLLNEIQATEWEKVSDFLEKNKYINNEQTRLVTGILQRDKMTQMLKRWAKQGLLIQLVPASGYVRGTKYRLPASSDFDK